MFLKRLETIGFKSFAERINMDFVSGVTAVVGPNGSGKSNVIDAIRWVLGEQSAKSIRGQKMEDIIFQGSDTRKALNFAEVSLILNNEKKELPIDYQEVNVTRRVYRSGESEFYLNKQACRLKDIIELFMDTGLGKESFSIIGQGKIDEILSSKAEERRAVFEEAAGVLKYKQRKKKAEFKLMDTAENLDRVEDILYEITQQLSPLESQAAAARKYQTYQSELQATEVSLLVTEIERLHEAWQQVLKEVDAHKRTLLEKKTAIQKKEAKLTEKRESNERLEQSITKQQQTLLDITEQLEQDEGKRNVLLEQGKYENENKRKLQEQKRLSENHLSTLQQTRTEEEQQLEAIVLEIDQLRAEIYTISNELRAKPDEIEAMIEHAKSDYIEELNEQAVNKNELERLTDQSKQLMNQQAKREETQTTTQDTEASLVKEKEAVKAEVATLKQTLKTEEEKEKTVLLQLEEDSEKLEGMKQKLAVDKEQKAKVLSRKEMLEEMKDAYQGFYHGAKEILQAKKRGELDRIFGAVIDLIHIPENYMTAMETVLGAQAQYIVTRDDHAARNGINWLKRHHKGRATFLPLQSIGPKHLPPPVREKLKKQTGFIGVASELITTEKAFERLKAYLLGNVLVADHLQRANEMAALTQRKFRIVTLDGDIVFPGGSMSGGAKKKNNQSLFTREKEIAQLTVKLDELTKQTTAYEAKIEAHQTKQQRLWSQQTEIAKAREAAKAALDNAQQTLHVAELNHSRAATEAKNFTAVKEYYQTEQEKLENRKQALLARQTKLQTSLAAKEKEIEQLSQRKKGMEQNKKKLEDELHALKVKQAEREERKRAIQERHISTDKEYESAKSQLKQVEAELAVIMDEAERQELEQSIAGDVQRLKTRREELSAKLEMNRNNRNVNIQKAADEEQEIKGMQQALDADASALQQKEVQANRLDVALENDLNRLQSVYKITYERARQAYDHVADVEKAKQQVEALTAAIERLGTVNLGAIDEFERLSERESFLRDQQGDLLDAKETLYQVIQEMDTEMTKRFREVFEEIQAAFTVVFQTLFGGGDASLFLTNPEDMLETGIEITARPPGKKLKTLELLSGGERALTAIALLFAILQVRPVPFCILDEVDAALDEANIERFGKYLQSFSEDTQFIIITHRKGTMEEANALYGITMQESGVSRLVSVKLEEAKPLIGTK